MSIASTISLVEREALADDPTIRSHGSWFSEAGAASSSNEVDGIPASSGSQT